MPSKTQIINVAPVATKSAHVTINAPADSEKKTQIIATTPTLGRKNIIQTSATQQVARPSTPKNIDVTEESKLAQLITIGCDYSKYQQNLNAVSPGVTRFGDLASANPINRHTVEKVQAPETASNMRRMFESGKIPDLHEVKKTVPEIEMVAPGSGVFENTPTRNEGVIRNDDVVNDNRDDLSGVTRNLVEQFKLVNLGKVNIERGPINMAEDEGKVLENQPTRRSDVYRENDREDHEDVRPGDGFTNSLLTQWINMKDSFVKDDRPIQLIENPNEKSVLENEPQVRTDVLREDDQNDEIWMKRGMTKDLTSHWSSIKNVPILARDHGIDMPVNQQTVILENEPIRLDGVVRESDPHIDDSVALDGLAKNMTDRWLNIKDERMPKDPFRLEAELGNEAGVYENVPSQVADHIIRHSDPLTDCMTKEGLTRIMQNRFVEEVPVQGERKQMIQMNLAEGDGVYENQPISLGPDVYRNSDEIDDKNMLGGGATKDLVHRWRNLDVESVFGGKTFKTFDDPMELLEHERKFESGVYENTPTVRDDVLREIDYEQEVIDAPTQQLKTTWKLMGLDKPRDTAQPSQIRFTPPRELSPSDAAYYSQEVQIQ